MEQKIYQYAVFYQPTKKELDDGTKAAFIIEPQFIIVPDENTAVMKAGMSIPPEYAEKLDQVKIVVRPF